MPCYNRMKRIFLQGLLWLYLFGFGFMALSLEPGFLDFDNLPDTNFTCVGKVIGGYYADLETNCQMFHVCTIGQLDEPMDIRFLCLNGTVFDQETRVCERIDEVDCSKSEQFYSLNLELYGNSQPTNLEENFETEQPLIIKSTTTSTTTTTTEAPKKTKLPYFTTLPPSKATSISQKNQILSHHFPVVNSNSPDIRFNPEEINISLHPGAPPDIRTKPFFSEKKVTDSDKQVQVVIASDSDKQSTASSAQKSGYNNRPSDINFEFAFGHDDDNGYETETLAQEYQFHREYRPSQEFSGSFLNSGPHHYKATTFLTPTTQKIPIYHPKSSTTARNYYIPHLKPPTASQHSHYIQHRTEKPPQRLQLPLPLLPSLPPLTFSSPAPFSLQHHIETKRYTKEHIPPPRIIISASASVSDASGRRLNYSLGTIGAAQILEEPPASYDDYKESDVVLDPFYHDVPKIKQRGRRKRSTEGQIKHSDIIKNDEEAVNVLKFLFDWYRNEKTNPARYSTTPLSAPLPSAEISRINDELQPNDSYESAGSESNQNGEIDFNFQSSDLFNKNSKYSIVGDDTTNSSKEHVKNTHDTQKNMTVAQNEPTFSLQDYVDDNYEPQTYKETYSKSKYQIDIPEYNNEEAKNYSIALDYVDDNIEPIYYRERHPDIPKKTANAYDNTNVEINFKKQEKHKNNTYNLTFDSERQLRALQEDEPNSSLKATTESPEEIIGTEQTSVDESTIGFTSYKSILEDITISANEFPKQSFNIDYNHKIQEDLPKDDDDKKTVKTEVSFVTQVSEEEDKIETSAPSVLIIDIQNETLPNEDITVANEPFDELTPTPTTENTLETNAINKHSINFDKAHDHKLNVNKPIRTTNLIKTRNDNRGRRRFNTFETTTKEPIIFKNVLIEKLVKKPYTAKDDYDFLRTLSNVYSSTFKSSPSEELASLIKDKELNNQEPKYSEQTSENIKPTEESATEISTKQPELETLSSNISTAAPSPTTLVPTTSAEITATFTTTTTTTERLITKNSRRRGRIRYNGESSHKSSRRRKPSKNQIQIEEQQIANVSLSKNEEFKNITIEIPPELHVSRSNNEEYKNYHDLNVAVPSNQHRNIKNYPNENHDTNVVEFIDPNIHQNHNQPTEDNSSQKIMFQDEPIQHIPSFKSYLDEAIDINKPIVANNHSHTVLVTGNDKNIAINDLTLIENHSQENDNIEYEQNDQKNIEPFSDIIDTTTEQIFIGRNKDRGTKTFLNEFSLVLSAQSLERGSTQKTLLGLQNLGTPSSLPTESLIQLPSSTTISSTYKNNFSQMDNIADVYATSFVPTEAIHVTKKKQLKTLESTETETTATEISTTDKLTTVTIPKLEEKNVKIDKIAENINRMDIASTTNINLDEMSTIQVQNEENQLWALGPPTTTENTEKEDKTIITDSLETNFELNKTDPITTTDKYSGREETQPPLWANQNFEKFVKEVESTTKSIVASAEKVFTEISKPIEERFKDYFGYYNSGTEAILQENEVREFTTENNKEEKIDTTYSYHENTQYYEHIKNGTIAEETTTDISTYPSTFPETTKYEVNEPISHITDLKEAVATDAVIDFETKTNTTVMETTTDTTKNTQIPTTLEFSTTEAILTSQVEEQSSSYSPRGSRRRNSKRKPLDHQRNGYKHRFISTEQFTRRPEGNKQTIENDIIDALTRNSNVFTTTASNVNKEIPTDAPLWRSANPTQSKRFRDPLLTTPLSRKMTVKKHYFFNCFNKEINRFYADPRDCRLFHYCTQGYNKNQLLDMKFVCDLNTYFDDENLVCTKKKPKRCL